MAALSVTNPTLLDLARASDPDGKIATIVEIMNEVNEVLDDMVVIEGNLPTGNITTLRSSIPTPAWRKLNEFVSPTKGRTVQITDNCGEMKAFTQVDKKLANINGNSAAWRLSEDRVHIEGMAQEFANTLFYGSEGTQPEAFTGFGPRYNALSGIANSENIITGGGSGSDNGSIWLIVWGADTVFGIVPKGSKAGVEMQDLGEETAIDSNGALMRVLRSEYTWNAGLAVRDWRYAVRIPNIDKSLLTKDAASGADLADLMFQAMRRVPSLSRGKPAFYMSRDMITMLSRQTVNLTKGSTLTAEMVGGKLVTSFQGIPVRRVDALSADETVVS